MRDVWRSTTTARGELYAITSLAAMTHASPATCWDFGIFEQVQLNLYLLPAFSAFYKTVIRRCTDIVAVLLDMSFWRDVITDHPVSL